MSNSVKNENWLKLLNENEIISLKEYLYSLNSNVNWNIIIEKHLDTNNEKFIKHVKSLTWEDHPTGILTQSLISEFKIESNYKCKNIYDHISELMFKIDFEKFMNKIIYKSSDVMVLNTGNNNVISSEVSQPSNEEIIAFDDLNNISGGENNYIFNSESKDESKDDSKLDFNLNSKPDSKDNSNSHFNLNFNTHSNSNSNPHSNSNSKDNSNSNSKDNSNLHSNPHSNLHFNVNSNDDSIKILKPNLDANISEFVKEYYVLIMEEYETFFKTYNIRYKYIDLEEDNCILLGHLTKDVNYNSSMILDYSFPINYNLSENYNKLMMLIFENINSNEFNFNILNYRFLTL